MIIAGRTASNLQGLTMPYDPETRADLLRLRAILVPLIGVPLIAWLAWSYVRDRDRRTLPQTGATAEGSVLEFQVRGDQRLLSYVFDARGRVIRALDRRVDGLDKAKPGKPITVWYNPNDPGFCISEPELQHARTGWTWLALVATSVLFVVLMGATIGQMVQRRRLLRARSAVGTVS